MFGMAIGRLRYQRTAVGIDTKYQSCNRFNVDVTNRGNKRYSIGIELLLLRRCTNIACTSTSCTTSKGLGDMSSLSQRSRVLRNVQVLLALLMAWKYLFLELETLIALRRHPLEQMPRYFRFLLFLKSAKWSTFRDVAWQWKLDVTDT